jgi:hypothetical protein
MRVDWQVASRSVVLADGVAYQLRYADSYCWQLAGQVTSLQLRVNQLRLRLSQHLNVNSMSSAFYWSFACACSVRCNSDRPFNAAKGQDGVWFQDSAAV